MTATRNTILAVGLTLLTLAARNSKILADGIAGCEGSCDAGCGGAGCPGGGGSFQGFCRKDFVHDPGCRYADNSGCLEIRSGAGPVGPCSAT